MLQEEEGSRVRGGAGNVEAEDEMIARMLEEEERSAMHERVLPYAVFWYSHRPMSGTDVGLLCGVRY
eukprot:2501089-Rhodomonas_salina.1